MKIKNLKKPSENTIKKCEDILAGLLKVHNFLSIKIVIRKKRRQTNSENLPLWIDSVILTTKDNEKVKINWWESFAEDINEKIDDNKLWSVAWSIQNAFCRKKNIMISDDPSDPFWKLWDYRK